MNTHQPPTPREDALAWLREVRRTRLEQAGSDFKKLGDHYRAVQAQHPEKTFDPHAVVIEAVKARRK